MRRGAQFLPPIYRYTCTNMMSELDTVWIVDDDKSIRWVLEKALQAQSIPVRTFESANAALRALHQTDPAAVICDIRMPGLSGFGFLEKIQVENPDVPVIIMTAHSDLESAVQAYQGGAFEYLPKPFDIDDAVNVVKRAMVHHRELEAQRPNKKPEKIELPETEIVGEAPAMQEVFRAIGRLSNSNITVLINGQSGTGKELVAHALHRHSPRAKGPFVALNMAAIPKDLIESELFGHEKGSFTGATTQRVGRFEQANGGTLFLDEIGDMPPDTQTRLLRVLADSEFFRVGAHSPTKVNVRIIAATHQDLEELVKAGRFREDLFHRLNVIRVHLPSLAERREDIGQLAEHFLTLSAKELETDVKSLSKDALRILEQSDWPGNVRQLQNTCRWLTVMGATREIEVDDLPPEILADSGIDKATGGISSTDWENALRRWSDQFLKENKGKLLDIAMPIFERTIIEVALNHTLGRKRDAAALLGWGRNTLTRKLKELGMHDSEPEASSESK